MLPCDIKGDAIAAIVHRLSCPRKKLANATIIMLYNYFGQYMNPLKIDNDSARPIVENCKVLEIFFFWLTQYPVFFFLIKRKKQESFIAIKLFV